MFQNNTRVRLTAYHPPLSEEGLGAAPGFSPEPWQVSESLVRCWGRVECQALDCLRISGLFSLHVQDGGSCALLLSRISLCRHLGTMSVNVTVTYGYWINN